MSPHMDVPVTVHVTIGALIVAAIVLGLVAGLGYWCIKQLRLGVGEEWDEPTKPKPRASKANASSYDMGFIVQRPAPRCTHPACGSQLVPATFDSNGFSTWRCIGCQTEYVK